MTRVVATAQRLRVPLLVDPKVPHIGRYAGATLLTPNHHEAEAASGVRIRTAADARRAARALAEQVRVDGVLITWGEHGLWLSYGAVEGHLPAAAREVADVTGAGDTVAATMGAAAGRRRDPGRSGAAGQPAPAGRDRSAPAVGTAPLRRRADSELRSPDPIDGSCRAQSRSP